MDVSDDNTAGPDRTDDTPDDRAIRDRLRRFSVRQQDFERHLAEQLAIDAAGLAAMNHLGLHGPATPTEIARRLDVSTAATTLVLARLESAGHIERAPHPSDGRKVVISASPSSLDTALQLVQPVIDGVEAITAAMTAQQRHDVVGFLDAMTDLYDRASRDRRR